MARIRSQLSESFHLEDGQHPTWLISQEGTLRAPGEAFPQHMKPTPLRQLPAVPAHGGGEEGSPTTASALGYMCKGDERQNAKAHDEYRVYASRVHVTWRQQGRNNTPTMWSQVRDSVKVSASAKYKAKGCFDMTVDAAIKDPTLRAMIEDCLFNNVGAGVDEFVNHPDNALSLEDPAAYARGERSVIAS